LRSRHAEFGDCPTVELAGLFAREGSERHGSSGQWLVISDWWLSLVVEPDETSFAVETAAAIRQA
jgi:hypothetical protein